MTPSLKVTRRSGDFLERLQRRLYLWSAGNIKARITTPPELTFLYWQEFGTAASGDVGGSSYTITPVDAKMLAFPGPSGKTITDSVQHPGIKPRRMVTKVLPDIRRAASVAVHEAFIAGAADAPELLRQAIVKTTEEAKQTIVASIAENLPGTRPADSQYPKQAGRLAGRTASSVFEELAQVVDLSS